MKYWICRLRFILIAILLCSVGSVAAQNLVVNGSFERPTIPPGGIFFPSIPGWRLAFGPDIELQTAIFYPFDGNQYVELDSNANSGIFQDLPTVPAETYI